MTELKPSELGKVVVLLGGCSAEREVSLNSGAMVLKALQDSGVDAHPFDPAESSLSELEKSGFDRAVIALHGRFGEDGTIQGALEWMGIPYTGCGVTASALAMDKLLTKAVWLNAGLTTPKYIQLQPGFDVKEVCDSLRLPLIVKPAQEGSTLGLTKVEKQEDLLPAFELAYKYDKLVLAEQFIQGQELAISLLGEGDSTEALPIVRIVAPGGNYDYHNKYVGNETQYFCPSGLPAGIEAAIQKLCVQAYQELGCSGWGRADVLLDADNKPWLLEMNTSPGMTDHSLVPLSAKAAGIDFSSLVLRLATAASLKTKGGK